MFDGEAEDGGAVEMEAWDAGQAACAFIRSRPQRSMPKGRSTVGRRLICIADLAGAAALVVQMAFVASLGDNGNNLEA